MHHLLARNFISAAAFAAANGFVPFGNTVDVKRAFDALQLKGFRKDNEFYQELLELGVVSSQVQVRQVMDLMEDVKFGEVLNNCLLYTSPSPRDRTRSRMPSSA